jgi:uncharacterized oxidoreductase
MELKNNTILITGGTSGIGYELASRLIDLGNTVIITGRDQTKLDLAKKQLPKIHTFRSDVSDANAIKSLHEQVTKQFPELNILINNAGIMRKINLHDTDINTITQEIDINLAGPIRMVQQFLPHLKTKTSAAIMNVTSGLALIPFPIAPIYAATKSGLRSYTHSLRVQLKRTNIRVFELVAPAADTPLNDTFAGEVSKNTLMKTDKLVNVAIKGLSNDKLEIVPGLAVVLKLMSRLAPKAILKQFSKLSDKMLAEPIV